MPYILYTLGAHSASYLSTSTVIIGGYGRARAWQPRIMRVSRRSVSYVFLLQAQRAVQPSAALFVALGSDSWW